ncbi:unnamed protein product [Allacma fusca]|uniref:BRCA2 OB3 domain-containing protein n=1 Tax=Allacma fusca TaxID=39272 RepID=A0A8J2LUK0_9HEXA|nr:unnamed protein product [Allacma fusca]
MDPLSNFGGFSTASGKAVRISEEALKKARSLWETTDDDPSALGDFNEEPGRNDSDGEPNDMSEPYPEEGEKEVSGVSNFLGGFSTASGKKVSVSEEALKKARSLWDESKESVPTDLGKFTGGFMTASGSSVKVSEEALKKARDLWDNSTGEFPDETAGGGLSKGRSNASVDPDLTNEGRSSLDGVPLRAMNLSGGGFSTASGKSVKVSAEALKRAQSLWTEELTDKDQDCSEVKDISFSGDFDEPVQSSTPKIPDVILKERAKPKAFVTPFKKTGAVVGVKSALTNNSTNFISPVLSDRRVSHLKGSNTVPMKTLGTRPGKFTPPLRIPVVRTTDSLKRARGSGEDLTSNCKSPKLNPNRTASSIVDENVPTSLNESSSSSVTTPGRISVTESQEILYSSKALLDDDDDFDLMETDEIPPSESHSRPTSFANIIVDKKPVSHLRAWVARVYPVVFMCKTADGKIEYHSETSYEKIVKNKESTQSKEMEQLFIQVEEERRKALAAASPSIPLSFLRKDNLNNLNVGDLLKIIESGDDFSNIHTLLSDSKLAQVREAQERKREEVRREIQKEVEIRFKKLCFGYLSVSPVLRIRLSDLSFSTSCETNKSSPNAVLSFWRPCEDLRTSLTECLAIDIFSVSPSQIYDDIKLNSTRETRIQPFHLDDVSREKLRPFLRRCYSFEEVMNEDFSPPFREFDIVGLIVQIEDATSQMGETIYMSDVDENIISIKFWRTLSDEGLENVLQVGCMVSASNVQWRQSSLTGVFRIGYCQDTTRFSLQPKESYLQETLATMKKVIQDADEYISKCSRKIQLMLNGEVIDTPKTPPLVRRIQPHIFEPSRKRLIEDDKFV